MEKNTGKHGHTEHFVRGWGVKDSVLDSSFVNTPSVYSVLDSSWVNTPSVYSVLDSSWVNTPSDYLPNSARSFSRIGSQGTH